MGMFDSFRIKYQSEKYIEVQTKRFDSSLAVWEIGQRVNNSIGLSIYLESFDINGYYGDRKISRNALLVILDGVFVDYGVCKDDLEVDKLTICLRKLWENDRVAKYGLMKLLNRSDIKFKLLSESVDVLKNTVYSYKDFESSKGKPPKKRFSFGLLKEYDFDKEDVGSLLITQIDEIEKKDVMIETKSYISSQEYIANNLKSSIESAVLYADISSLLHIYNDIIDDMVQPSYKNYLTDLVQETHFLYSSSYVFNEEYLLLNSILKDVGCKVGNHIFSSQYIEADYMLNVKGLSVFDVFKDNLENVLSKYSNVVIDYIYCSKNNMADCVLLFGDLLKNIEITSEMLSNGEIIPMPQGAFVYNKYYFLDYLVEMHIDIDNILNDKGENFICAYWNSNRLNLYENSYIQYVEKLLKNGVKVSIDKAHNGGVEIIATNEAQSKLLSLYESSLLISDDVNNVKELKMEVKKI